MKTINDILKELEEYGPLHNENCCVNDGDCDADIKTAQCCVNMITLSAFLRQAISDSFTAVRPERATKHEEHCDCRESGPGDIHECDCGYFERNAYDKQYDQNCTEFLNPKMP